MCNVPIHDPGYREWHGVRAALLTRWMVVAEIGIRRAWLSMWLRRMMFFAWMPAALMGFLIFVYEQASGRDEFAGEAVIGLSQMLLEPGAGGGDSFPMCQNWCSGARLRPEQRDTCSGRLYC